MIINTDVLIWYMKENETAYKAIERANNFLISVVTYMELVQFLKISQPAVSKCLRAIGYTPQSLVKSLTVTYKLMYVPKAFLSLMEN